jgi:hypothetical protein
MSVEVNLTPRCVVWDLEEVEAWLEQRRQAYIEGRAKIAPAPDVHRRKIRPVKRTDTRKSHEHDSTNGAVPGGRSDKDASDNPIDPRAFGLAKAAYGVGETLDMLSIGRTSLYAAVKRGDLKRIKFGKKTLFYAADLASFLTKLGRLSEADAHRVSHAPGASKSTKRS